MIFWLLVIAAILMAAWGAYCVLGIILAGAWAISYLVLSRRYGRRAGTIGSLAWLWVFSGALMWMLDHDWNSVKSLLAVVGVLILWNSPLLCADK